MRICRESLLTESSRMILSGRKGATAPFSCLPARTGSGRARSWVKGWIPCGYSGQRPEPSESFSSSISTVFKVLLSLFFHGSFFIDYLTLPLCIGRMAIKGSFRFSFALAEWPKGTLPDSSGTGTVSLQHRVRLRADPHNGRQKTQTYCCGQASV